jgi:hypothetical protein
MTNHSRLPKSDASQAIADRKQCQKMRSQNRLSRGFYRFKTPFFVGITFNFYVLHATTMRTPSPGGWLITNW